MYHLILRCGSSFAGVSSAPSCEHVVERSSRGRGHPLSYLVAEPGLAETPPSLLSSRSIPTAISKYYRLALFASRSSAAAPGKPSSSDEERNRAARNDGEVSASNMPTIPHAKLVIGLLHHACVPRNAGLPARNDRVYLAFGACVDSLDAT